MTEEFTQQQYEFMENWLDANGYGTPEGWAADSGYTSHGEAESDTLYWMDENGNYVDLYVCLWFAIEAEQELAEEVKVGV